MIIYIIAHAASFTGPTLIAIVSAPFSVNRTSEPTSFSFAMVAFTATTLAKRQSKTEASQENHWHGTGLG